MMNKKINFVAATKEIYDSENPPIPAYLGIPDWFKNIPPERNSGSLNPRLNSTVKKCIPFVDALTSGYLLRVPQDIYIGRDSENNIISEWSVARLESRPPHQPILVFDADKPDTRYKGIAVPDGFHEQVWRMNLYPRIETPDGYSILVTHPLNRYDLPFLSLSGVIDSDKLHGPMAVSMFLKKDFIGIIPKDTPVAQIIPFKRENWEHEILPPYSDKKDREHHFKIFSKMVRSYQYNFWEKKSYK